MPVQLYHLENILNDSIPEFLSGLGKRTSGNKSNIIWEHDVELGDELTHRLTAEERHANDSPDHGIHRKFTATERCDLIGVEGSLNDIRRKDFVE